MKLAIVGSTELSGNGRAMLTICGVLDRLRPELVISGGAKGIDSMAVAEAESRGIPTLVFRPTVRNWEFGFKPRNIQIAEACDHLVRIFSPTSRTYGSGWTRDYAARLGKPTEEYGI